MPDPSLQRPPDSPVMDAPVPRARLDEVRAETRKVRRALHTLEAEIDSVYRQVSRAEMSAEHALQRLQTEARKIADSVTPQKVSGT